MYTGQLVFSHLMDSLPRHELFLQPVTFYVMDRGYIDFVYSFTRSWPSSRGNKKSTEISAKSCKSSASPFSIKSL